MSEGREMRVAPAWERVLHAGALMGLGFFASFSTAGPALALAVLLVLSLLRPRATWGGMPWREPVVLAGLALFGWVVVHTLFTTGFTHAGGRAINRYHELLLLPLVLVMLREPRHRQLFLRALVAGAVLVALAYWTLRSLPGLQEDFILRRISASFALSVTAFLAVMHARQARLRWLWRGLAAFLALTVLFAMEARTGHLLLIMLATLTAWLHAPGRWRWAALVAAPLVVVAIAWSSGSVQSRLAETFQAAPVTAANEEITSTSMRRELVQLALDLSRKYWATGAGYANYGKVHVEAAQERYDDDSLRAHYLDEHWIHTPNPHNEYAMQLVGGGIVGLALFVAWLAATLRAGLRTRPPAGPMLVGAVLAYALGNVFNSMLMDFVEGHFYLAVLGMLLAQRHWPAPASGEEPVRSVLVVTTRQIGDVLLTTPLLRQARLRWPQARITVLGLERTLGMLQGNGDADERIEVPARLGAGSVLALVRRLWRSHDLALVADTADRAHLLGWIAARERSGVLLEGTSSNWWKRPLLRHVVMAAGDRGGVHAAVEKHALLAPWLPVPLPAPPAVVAPPAAPLPLDLRQALRPGCVVVHAPSMWAYKQWPLAHYDALVRDLLAQGRQVVLTGSASARDQECIAPLRRLGEAPQLLDASGRLDFNQLVALFDAAALYIGPDTSVSHLAAATGLPVIAIFGPTNPLRWAPLPGHAAQPLTFARRAPQQQAGNVVLLQGPNDCVPCGRAGCEDHRDSRSDCLTAITPDRVLEQAWRLLETDGAAGASRVRRA